MRWNCSCFSSDGTAVDVLNDNLFVTTMRGWVYHSEVGEQFTLLGKADSPKIDYRVRSTATGNGMIIGAGDFGTLVVIRPKQPSISFRTMAGQDEKEATLRRSRLAAASF